MFAHFSETLKGMTTIKAYKAEARFVKSLLSKVEHNNKLLFPTFACERWIAINLGLVSSLILLAVYLIIVIGRDSISPGLAGLLISNVFEVIYHFISLKKNRFDNQKFIIIILVVLFAQTSCQVEWRSRVQHDVTRARLRVLSHSQRGIK